MNTHSLMKTGGGDCVVPDRPDRRCDHLSTHRGHFRSRWRPFRGTQRRALGGARLSRRLAARASAAPPFPAGVRAGRWRLLPASVENRGRVGLSEFVEDIAN